MCSENDHDFKPQGRSYYKQFPDARKGALGVTIYDQTVSYQMLYCPKCGETKEIIAADYRQQTA